MNTCKAGSAHKINYSGGWLQLTSPTLEPNGICTSRWRSGCTTRNDGRAEAKSPAPSGDNNIPICWHQK